MMHWLESIRVLLEVKVLRASLIKDERPSLCGIRKGNIFVADLSSGPGNEVHCFYAKASAEDRWLWHKKLSHLNLKTMNSIGKRDLVRGLPSLEFSTDDLCEACQKGKAKRASHKGKTINTITNPLHLLHLLMEEDMP